MNYHEPKIKSFHLKDSPHSWWDDFARDIQICEHNNNEKYQTARKHYAGMLELAKLVYGDTSKELKYLKNNAPASPPNFSRLKLKWQRKWELFLQEQQDREYRRDYAKRHKEALQRLEKAGYVAGEDFPEGKAISFEKRLGNEADNSKLQDYRNYDA